MDGSGEDGEGNWDPTGDLNNESSMETSIALRITLAELINDLKNWILQWQSVLVCFMKDMKRKKL